MYTPPHFNETDLRWLDWLAEHDSFGTLISSVGGAPFATHLPVLYRRESAQVTLTGHWARPNQQWREIEGQLVLFIFHGPHAYVSPRWYTEPGKNVPTWNYATAHVYGRVRLIEEPEALVQLVSRLADRFELGAQVPWSFSSPDAQQRVRGIVGFELAAERVELKFKLSQNHPTQNIEGVIAGLSGEDRDDSRSVVELMRSALTNRPKAV